MQTEQHEHQLAPTPRIPTRGHHRKIRAAFEALTADGQLPPGLLVKIRNHRIRTWLVENNYGPALPSDAAIARHFPRPVAGSVYGTSPVATTPTMT